MVPAYKFVCIDVALMRRCIGASLHNYMQNSDGGAINSFELTVARDPQFNHMAPLNAVPDQWERVLAAIEDLLQRGRKLGHE